MAADSSQCHSAPQITVILLKLWHFTNCITCLLTHSRSQCVVWLSDKHTLLTEYPDASHSVLVICIVNNTCKNIAAIGTITIWWKYQWYRYCSKHQSWAVLQQVFDSKKRQAVFTLLSKYFFAKFISAWCSILVLKFQVQDYQYLFSKVLPLTMSILKGYRKWSIGDSRYFDINKTEYHVWSWHLSVAIRHILLMDCCVKCSWIASLYRCVISMALEWSQHCGSETRPKGWTRGGVLGGGVVSPFPTTRGSGEHCKLPQWGPRVLVQFGFYRWALL